jgi:hypothetical protein
MPPEHASVLPQTSKHEPQLALSVCVSAQYGLPASGVQNFWLPVHAAVHVEATQVCCGLHALKQPLQFSLSICVLAQ